MSEKPDHLSIVAEADSRRATDIHIDPLADGYAIRFRIDGIIHDVREIGKHAGERIVNQFKANLGLDSGVIFSPKGARRTLTIGDKELDYRLTFAPCISGPKLAIRLLDPDRVRHRIEELGLDADGLAHFRAWLDDLNGMFLVSGPTASGKTTTLYALLFELAEHARHILTIEDPVEYELGRINQIQVDHKHGLTFAEGVKAILRLDPDYAMIGELREPESAQAAAAAAVAGHVILSTIHARDAVSSISALRNFGLTNHQIAVALGVVVNQRLVRVLCQSCRREKEVSGDAKRWFDLHRIPAPARDWAAPGCDRCEGTGYRGRTGVFEIWRLEEADYELLLADADEETLRTRLARKNHRALLDRARAKINDGITSYAEIRRGGFSLPWAASD